MDYLDETLCEPLGEEEKHAFVLAQVGLFIKIKCLADRRALQHDMLWSSIYFNTMLMFRRPSELKAKVLEIRKNRDDFSDTVVEIDTMIEKLRKECVELKHVDRLSNNHVALIFYPPHLACKIICLFGLENRSSEVLLLSKLAAVCQVLSDVIGTQSFLDENMSALYDSPEKKNMLFDWYNTTGLLSSQEIKVLRTASPERSKFMEQLISDLKNITVNLDDKYKLLESQQESIERQADLLFSGEFRDYDEFTDDEKQQLHNLVDEGLTISESLKCNLPIV